MWSFLAKYIALCILHLSALRASQVGFDLYFLKICSLFLMICFYWVIPLLTPDLGGCWVTTFVLSGAMASSADCKLPKNLDTSSSKSLMSRREQVSMAFPNKLVSMDLIFVILKFLMCECGFWYVERHFHCKVIWSQWALSAAADDYVAATFSEDQIQGVA